MANHRLERLNGQLQRELSILISQKVKDARVRDASIVVTKVKATPDMKEAVVYVSITAPEEEKKEVMEALKHASGFLRSQLGRILRTYTTPSLVFKLDDSVEYGMHIESILRDLKEQGAVSEQPLESEDE